MGLGLTACGSTEGLSGGNGGTTKKSGTQLTGQTNDDYYQGVIKDGHYQTSKSRGVTLQQSANQFNVEGFQNGLVDISKKEYPTDKYIFQEGQYISTKATESWLSRQSKTNPDGLNPKDNKSKSETKRNPIYLSQIDEQDFMTEDKNKLELSGMTIGLAINSVDYYKKEPYGPTFETNISDEMVKEEGQKIANQVLSRLRKRSELKNVPILIALYKQASDDSLIGGNFFSYAVAGDKSTSIKKWNAIDQKNYVFPIVSGKNAPNSNDSAAFNNFKSQVENFFPNLSGITAQVQYTDGALSKMNVNITTQFYSQTEITSFTQYIQEAAQKYLPANTPININVQSTDGIQSFLSRDRGEKQFSMHIFNGY